VTASADIVRVERDGAIAVVTLNDPSTMNALSDAMTAALVDAVSELDADEAIRCMVLTGAGRGFSAGGSLVEMEAGTGLFAGTPDQVRDGFDKGIQTIPRLLHGMEMPIVAAVNGPAYGAGLDLAAMCDIRVAAATATFAESFVRVGLVAGDGGNWFLPRLIGLGRAMEMTLTAAPIDAQTALAWGLINRVVAPSAVLDAALETAGRIAVHPRNALRMSRKLIRQSLDLPLEASLGLAAAMQAIAIGSAEQQAALSRFLAGRRKG